MQMFIGGVLLWVFLGFACLFPVPQAGILRKIRIAQIYFYIGAPIASAILYYLGASIFADFLGGSALRNVYAVLVVSSILSPFANIFLGVFISDAKKMVDKISARAFAYPFGILAGLLAFGVDLNPDKTSAIANVVPNALVNYLLLPLSTFFADLFVRAFG